MNALPSSSFLQLLRGFSPQVQKNLAVLFFGQAMSTGATTVSTTLASIIVVHLTGEERLAGLPSTINFLVSAFAAWFSGRIMARHGRRVGLGIGFVVGAFGAVLAASMALSGNFLGFLLGGALVGYANGTVQQSRYAAAEMIEARVRGRVLGGLLFGSVLGALLSWALTPWVRHWAHGANLGEIEAGWYLGALLMAFAALAVWLLLFPDPSSLAQKTQTQNAVVAQARPFAELLRLPSFRLALVSMMVGQAVMVGLMVLMPLHAKHLGHDLPTITGLQTGHVVGMFGFAWLSGILADRFGRRALVVFGVVQLVISGVVAAGAFTVVPMAVSLFLLGTGWNACYVAGSTLLADALQANERASVQGSADLLVWLSAALGALGGGWIVGQFGFSTAAWVACVLACVPLVVLVLTPQAGSRAG